MQKLLSRPLFGALLVSIISFIVYLQTMAPSVPFIDGGELATVCATLGIAHPTGYPIFCMLGYVFAHLPIAEHIIMRLNIMSALFVALGSGGIVFVVSELYLFWFNEKRKKVQPVKGKKISEKPLAVKVVDVITEEKRFESVAAGIFAGLAMGLSATWWDTSSSIEVYPIHCFMIPIVLTFLFRMLRLEKEKFGKNSFLFALALGLCFSNHLTTILLAPACLYMFFATFGFKKEAWVRIVKLVPAFLAGLLPYLYFPIRASQYPLMDWGHPDNLNSFLKHFSGGQYSVMMFTKIARKINWPYFWGKYPAEFTIVGLILVICGLYSLLSSSGRGKAHLLPFVILLFFGCLLWSMNYEIVDIDSYFLTAYLASAITATFGIIWLLRLLREKQKVNIAIATIIAAIIFGGIQVQQHYKEVDESGNYFVEDYTINMLKNLPKDAIIFTSSWDFWASGAFYYQLVENIRPDVFVVDVAMLRDRPWYFNHLKQRAPEIMKRLEPELGPFMVDLVKFDRGMPFDTMAISQNYRTFTEAFVSKNSDRPIFVSPEALIQRDPLFAPTYKPYAAGLAYRLFERDSIFDVPLPVIQWRDSHYRRRNYYTENSRWYQALPLADRAHYLIQHGQNEDAKKFLDLALRFEPDINANTESLQGRDLEAANHTTDHFIKMEEFRKSLGK